MNNDDHVANSPCIQHVWSVIVFHTNIEFGMEWQHVMAVAW